MTFCQPEIVAVGLTEREARETGHRVSVGRFPLRYLGKALTIGEDRGLVKLVTDKTSGRILGGHIIGPAAGELIHEVVVAMQADITAKTFAEAIHAYPTLSEAVGGAAADP